MPRNDEQEYVYNPLDRQTYESIAYNAVGRGSEINTLPAYRLTHSTAQSGWSVGIMQWDFGQPGRGEKVAELLSGYQAWAPEDGRFTPDEMTSLSTRLQTAGRRWTPLAANEEDRLNSYLRSDAGREFVNVLDREQIVYKWQSVGEPLSRIPWLQELSRNDPAEVAEIVAMTSKRFNQGEDRGRELVRSLGANEMTSDDVREYIGTVSVRERSAQSIQAITTGRDNTLNAVGLMNALEMGDGRLAEAWRQEVHTNGNVGLSQGFNNNPNVQLFDAMMRNPSVGSQIMAHVDDGAPARRAVISGLGADAALEMARVEQSREGTLTVRSPGGSNFEMTQEGWNRNGVPMQGPRPGREADYPDHTQGMRVPSFPTPSAGAGDREVERERRTPDDPNHSDHAPNSQMPGREAAVTQRQGYRFFPRTPEDDYVDAYLDAADRGDYAARHAMTHQYEQLPHVQAMDQQVRAELEVERQQALEAQQRQEQERRCLAQQEQEHSHSRGRSM